MPPVTRHSTRGHASGGPRYGDSPREQGIATLVKARRHRKPEKPDKQTEEDPGEPNASSAAPAPPNMDMEVETEAPLTTPQPQSPNEQLGLELTKHANIALQTRAAKEKEEDKEILEILTLLDKKVSSMKQRSLARASSFGNALQIFVHNYFTQPGTNTRDQGPTTNPGPASPPMTYATISSTSKSESKSTKKTYTAPTKPERPLRLFLRLPTDHPARHASPHAALQKLHSSLDPAITDTIKEIQHVPTGLAIGPKSTQAGQILHSKKEEIQQVIQGSNAELEQKWAIFVIPGAIKQYIGYDGSMVTVSEQAAKEEFKLQTGVTPLKLHWSRKDHIHNTENTATMILATPESAISDVPHWIHFFGRNLRIRRKNINPKVQQCARCWDFHNPRTCTRQPKCRICGAKDHTEQDHKESTQRCANCLGPAPADHAAAIRRIESKQQQTPPSKNNTAVEAVPRPTSPQ